MVDEINILTDLDDLLESTKILAEIINPQFFPSEPNIKRWIPF